MIRPRGPAGFGGAAAIFFLRTCSHGATQRPLAEVLMDCCSFMAAVRTETSERRLGSRKEMLIRMPPCLRCHAWRYTVCQGSPTSCSSMCTSTERAGTFDSKVCAGWRRDHRQLCAVRTQSKCTSEISHQPAVLPEAQHVLPLEGAPALLAQACKPAAATAHM